MTRREWFAVRQAFEPDTCAVLAFALLAMFSAPTPDRRLRRFATRFKKSHYSQSPHDSPSSGSHSIVKFRRSATFKNRGKKQ